MTTSLYHRRPTRDEFLAIHEQELATPEPENDRRIKQIKTVQQMELLEYGDGSEAERDGE